MNESAARELLDLGAVYIGEKIKGQDLTKWRRWEAAKSHQASGASKTPPSPAVRPLAPETTLPPGSLLRCHPRPKRFPACGSTDWPAAVVHADDKYIVINKPAGLPCMRHESNATEHVAACASKALLSSGALPPLADRNDDEDGETLEASGTAESGVIHRRRSRRAKIVRREQELEVCHRLDTWTTGLMVLSRTKQVALACGRPFLILGLSRHK